MLRRRKNNLVYATQVKNKDTEPDSDVANGGSVGMKGPPCTTRRPSPVQLAPQVAPVTYYVEKGDATC